MRISDKRGGLANVGACNGKYLTSLPLLQLSRKAAEADTFEEFPTSLMGVSKTSDDVNVSIFTKYGVTIHKEEDILITCKNKPILIRKRVTRQITDPIDPRPQDMTTTHTHEGKQEGNSRCHKAYTT